MASGNSWERKEKRPDPFLPQESQRTTASPPDPEQHRINKVSVMPCRGCSTQGQPRRDSPGGTARCPLEWEENCSKLSWPLLHGLPEQKLDIFFLLDHLPLTALWNSPVFPVAQDRPESGGSRHFQTVTSTGQDAGAGTAPSPLCRRGERLFLFSDCDGNVRLKSLHSPPVPASPLPGKRRRNSRCRGQPLLRLRLPELPRG